MQAVPCVALRRCESTCNHSLNTCVEDNCTCPSPSAAGCGTGGSSGRSSLRAQAPSTLQCVWCQLTHWGKACQLALLPAPTSKAAACVESPQQPKCCATGRQIKPRAAASPCREAASLQRHRQKKRGDPKRGNRPVVKNSHTHTHPTHACWWQTVEPHVCLCSVSCATGKRTHPLSAPVPAHSGVPTALLRGTEAGVLKCPVL